MSQDVSWVLWKPTTKLDLTDKADSSTFRRSSAASSFFWISSREGSRRCGMEVLSSGTPSKDGGLRMTSKAWPEARLFSSITSTSLMTHQPRSTASAGSDRYEGPRPQENHRTTTLRVISCTGIYFTFCFVCGIF